MAQTNFFMKRRAVKAQAITSKLFRGYNEYQVGDIIEGKLVAINHDDTYNCDSYDIKVEYAELKDNLFGKEHNIELQPNAILVLNGCGSIRNQLKSLDDNGSIDLATANADGTGALLHDVYLGFKYLGKEKLTSGKFKGKASHRFEVTALDAGDTADEEEPAEDNDFEL